MSRRTRKRLSCLAEVRRCRAIVGAGTSADAQLAIFDAHNATSHSSTQSARSNAVDRLDRRGHVAAKLKIELDFNVANVFQ